MVKKIEFGTNEDFITKYEELKSSRKMGEFYGCTKNAILNHAKKIGYNVNSNKTYKLSEQDKEYIKLCYNTKTSTELAKELNVSRGMITKIWYDANLKGKEHTGLGATKIDLIGQKFGRLTVVREDEKRTNNGSVYWYCECECGGNIITSSSSLRNGSTKSCGCLSKENLEIGRGLNFDDKTGKIYGKLTVLKRAEDICYKDRHVIQWLCQCECGRQTKVISSNLATGNTQSCGFCGNNSHGNIKIETLLKDNNIIFEREKRFQSCIDKAQLPFDFYVNNSYLIEYDGKQHFDNTGSIFDYDYIRRHDEIKNKWCKENNIPLIRIPYTQYDNLTINDLLLETSKFIQK